MARSSVLTALVLIAMLAPAALGSAQGTTGSISGFVTDDTGGALPGTTVTVRHVETDQQQVDRGMGTQVSIAGARPNQISYQIDGTDANTQGNGSPGSAAGGLLGVETVREFQVLVNNYSAEYGRSTGGIVTAVTRSGTNAFKGTLFEFNRDSRFD